MASALVEVKANAFVSLMAPAAGSNVGLVAVNVNVLVVIPEWAIVGDAPVFAHPIAVIVVVADIEGLLLGLYFKLSVAQVEPSAALQPGFVPSVR